MPATQPRNLQGQKALVTGATSGIGRAVALQLARDGAEVIVHGRDAARGAETVESIAAAGGRARFVGADLSDPADLQRLVEAVGDIDVLVNNAGFSWFGATPDLDVATFDALFASNVRSAPNSTRRSHYHPTAWGRALRVVLLCREPKGEDRGNSAVAWARRSSQLAMRVDDERSWRLCEQIRTRDGRCYDNALRALPAVLADFEVVPEIVVWGRDHAHVDLPRPILADPRKCRTRSTLLTSAAERAASAG